MESNSVPSDRRERYTIHIDLKHQITWSFQTALQSLTEYGYST